MNMTTETEKQLAAERKVAKLHDALRLINEELTDRMDDGDFCKPSLVRALNSIKKTLISIDGGE